MNNDWGFADKDPEKTFVSPFAVKQHGTSDEALKAILKDVKADIARNELFKGASDLEAVIQKVGAEQIESYNVNAASLGRPALLASSEEVYKYLFDYIIDWGPLSDAMNDDSIEDIIVVNPNRVVVWRAGAEDWEEINVTFESWEEIRQIVNHKIDHRGTGKAISEANPQIDAQLPDGSRLHAVMSPMTVEPGPVVTIRRFRNVANTLDQLIALGHMTVGAANLLRAAMKAKLSIIVMGGTGSGKTTLLKALLSLCGLNERIITCEDTPELILPSKNWTQMVTREPTRNGGDDGVDMTFLVKQTLRMRPTRIIIGETRGGEMASILQAGNTGHSGLLCTLHANDPFTATTRVETMALMDKTMSSVPVHYIRQMIPMAFHLIVHVGHVHIGEEGTRRLLSVTELLGMAGEQIGREELLRYDAERHLALFNAYPTRELQTLLKEACPDFDFKRDVVEAERQ